MAKNKKTPDIAEYDLSKYDYEQYWKQGRDYEHESDMLALRKLLRGETGDWYIDLGGSYGRTVSAYRSKFLHCVLSDYSIEALKKARKNLKERRIQNVNLVAANIYNLPFKDESFSGAQMVRVLHHIENPELGITEIARIIRATGIFNLEFANKIHFIAKVRAFLKFKLGFIFDKSPYMQPSRKTKQGTKSERGLFYNFHPKYIQEIMRKSGFKIVKKLSVSNLRSGFFKKLFSTSVLIKIEKLLQDLLAPLNFGPSQYYKLLKSKGKPTTCAKNIYEILCCPKCGGNLLKKHSDLICEECGEKFPITYGILDLRWPRPTTH